MYNFKTKRSFKANSEKITHHKIVRYFKEYGFLIKEKGTNNYLFYKKSTWLEGWKMNPLQWESEIQVFIINDEIQISYNVAGVYVSPYAFKDLYNSFLANFENYIIKNDSFILENKSLVKAAKNQLCMYYGILLIGVWLAYSIAMFFNKFFGSFFFGMLVLYGVCRLFEKLLNYYIENKTYS